MTAGEAPVLRRIIVIRPSSGGMAILEGVKVIEAEDLAGARLVAAQMDGWERPTREVLSWYHAYEIDTLPARWSWFT